MLLCANLILSVFAFLLNWQKREALVLAQKGLAMWVDYLVHVVLSTSRVASLRLS